ncbi:hypothetical protein BT96DRAFT_939723 [Gymnopus androsaceus JB14]|uniref:Uncharacterized protein n=1 Tax=Gymnopus androsaceus JB14 TaxID=1447944 RepID=A0A6A4HJQ1_9AGAR|nr:hypothetical protein BT96DRAFT_939723 [Gymnopus androsaceus JB14]
MLGGDETKKRYGAPSYHIRRADLHNLLYDLAKPHITFRHASRVSSIDPSTPSALVHPIPTCDNTSILNEVYAEKWALICDMRLTYMNDTSVTEQVNQIKSRPNLLLWYSADEPGGTSDPLNATSLAQSLITSLDGSDGNGGAGYHPVSLMLNCENFFWSEYASGADVLLQDTYMIGNNVTFLNQWFTPCTVDFGDCGCDNCQGVNGVGSFTVGSVSEHESFELY